MNNDDKRIDDIISMLDNFTSKDGGRMNITINNNVNAKKIDITNSSDCAKGNVACNVPTLFEGVDDNK